MHSAFGDEWHAGEGGGACGMAVREEPRLTAGHATPSTRVAHCTYLVQAAAQWV